MANLASIKLTNSIKGEVYNTLLHEEVFSSANYYTAALKRFRPAGIIGYDSSNNNLPVHLGVMLPTSVFDKEIAAPTDSVLMAKIQDLGNTAKSYDVEITLEIEVE